MMGRLVSNGGRGWVCFSCCLGVSLLTTLYLIGNDNHQDNLSTRTHKYLEESRQDMLVKKGQVLVDINEVMKGTPIKLSQDDPRILNYVRSTGILREPSEKPYNLTQTDKNPSMGQGQFILKLFKDQRDGFFVECGALDGETLSNTLTLEKDLGWKGMLVEGDPKNFELLVTKQRKACASKACLATKPCPHEVEFLQYFNIGKILGTIGTHSTSGNTVTAQCIPFYTLLASLNISQVDYFSLDVEGNELDVLKTIPFDLITIKALSVELFHVTQGKSELEDFMKSKAYLYIQTITHPNNLANDFIFLHSNYKSLLQNIHST